MTAIQDEAVDAAAQAVYLKTPSSASINWELLPRIVQHEIREVALTAINAASKAGFGKHREVTTTDDLDALPPESVVRSRGGIVWEKYPDEDELAFWMSPGSQRATSPKTISLPATVLYEPGVPA